MYDGHNETEVLHRELQAKGIFRVTLNDPDSRNALSELMLLKLRDVLDQVESDPKVRVVVLAATGPVFCAGHDLK